MRKPTSSLKTAAAFLLSLALIISYCPAAGVLAADYPTVSKVYTNDSLSELADYSGGIKTFGDYAENDVEKKVFIVQDGAPSRRYVTYKADGAMTDFSLYVYYYGKYSGSGAFEVFVSRDGENFEEVTSDKLKFTYPKIAERFPSGKNSYFSVKCITSLKDAVPSGTRYLKLLFPPVEGGKNSGAMVGDVTITSLKAGGWVQTESVGDLPASDEIRLWFENPMGEGDLPCGDITISDNNGGGSVRVKETVFEDGGASVRFKLSRKLSPNSEYTITLPQSSKISEEYRSFSFHTQFSNREQQYNFDTVTIGGGGMVTGALFHPTEPNLLYARTDVGGVYRRDFDKGEWIPLMDNFYGIEDEGLRAVWGIALDKNNPDVIYAACGGHWYLNGCIAKSEDRGETWKKTGLAAVFNGREGRRYGECIAVDPRDSDTVLCGTPYQGVFISRDGGDNWTQCSGIQGSGVPTSSAAFEKANNVGVCTIIFDEYKKGVVYAGYNGSGVYVSRDNGVSWSLIENSPKYPRSMAIFGTKLYVSCGASGDTAPGLWKWNGTEWVNEQPAAGVEFNALATTRVDGIEHIFAASDKTRELYYRHTEKAEWTTLLDGQTNASRSEIDPHSSWLSMSHNANERGIIAGQTCCLAVPSVSTDGKVELWLGDGYTIWCNTDALNLESKFTAQCRHLEETVVRDISAPPSGDTALLSGIYDYCGLRHTDINQMPTMPNVVWTTNYPNVFPNKYLWSVVINSIDYCGTNPKYMAYSADVISSGNYCGIIATSDDYGATWKNLGYKSGSLDKDVVMGEIAVGGAVEANGLPVIVAVQCAASGASKTVKAMRSEDFGKTWSEISSLPENLLVSDASARHILEADSVSGNRFYLYDYKNGDFWYSSDKGAIFQKSDIKITTEVSSSNSSVNISMDSNPNVEGDVLFTNYVGGLFRSTDGGVTVTKVDGISKAEGVTFGANVPGTDTASIFLLGEIDNRRGLYRSDDNGKSWIYCFDPNNKLGNMPRVLEGDKRVFGRIYIGTGGRGIMYGDTAGVNLSLSAKHQSSGVEYSADATFYNYTDDNEADLFLAFYEGDRLQSCVSEPVRINGTGCATVRFDLAGTPDFDYMRAFLFDKNLKPLSRFVESDSGLTGTQH